MPPSRRKQTPPTVLRGFSKADNEAFQRKIKLEELKKGGPLLMKERRDLIERIKRGLGKPTYKHQDT